MPVTPIGICMKPNATGKPHRSAKRAGNPQVKLVGVGLTDTLGWGEKEQLVRTSQPCFADKCLTLARQNSLWFAAILPEEAEPGQIAQFAGRKAACSFDT